MIRAFLFDIGNVLLKLHFPRALARLRGPGAEELGEEWERIKEDYECGKIERAEFQRRVSAVLRFTGTEEEFVSAWVDIFEVNEPMAALVEKLRGRYPLYLLSNTGDLHVDYFLKTYPGLFGMFSGSVFSHLVKCAKPGREIFETAIRQLNLVPEETIFIDDLPANVEAAARVGFRAIQYDLNNHAALLEALAREGVEL